MAKPFTGHVDEHPPSETISQQYLQSYYKIILSTLIYTGTLATLSVGLFNSFIEFK